MERNLNLHFSIDTASYVTPSRIRKSSVVRRRPQASVDFAEVNPELAQLPEASPVVALESSFALQTPHLIRSSRVVPRQRFTSPAVQPSLPQYLFESSEEPVSPVTPKKKVKGKKLGDNPRRIVSSRVQKVLVPLTSAPPPVPSPAITFYTTFTYLTTFLHGTHTVSSVFEYIHNFFPTQ